MRRLPTAALVLGLLRPAASAAPFLEYLFTGGGADRAAILTEGSLPVIGGAWGCGQYNQGAPSCLLRNPDQQCCAHDIKPLDYDLSGQTITIYVEETRGSVVFIEWLGVCRPTPTACVPGPGRPWCQGGLDYRGPLEPQTAAHTCTLTLPSGSDVQVTTRWEEQYQDALPPCGQFQALSGTCAQTATPSTTTTTLPFDQLPQFKKDALEQMKLEFEQALYPCLVAASGTVVIGVGGIAVGGIVGTVLLGVGTPLCAVHIAALQDLQKVYNDPPDPAFQRPVHVRPIAVPSLELPSCSGLRGKDRATCRRLEALAKRYAAAVERVKAVATALATTADRLSSANAAGNAKAAKKQAKQAALLIRRLKSAVRARGHAGAKLAALLRAAGIDGTLTASQTSAAVDAVLARLASQGIPVDTARRLLGSATTPAPVDVLATLGQ